MSLKKITIITILTLCGLRNSYAQTAGESPNRVFSLKLGVTHTYFKDLTFSPVNYKAVGPNLAMSYERKLKSSNLFYANLDLGFNNLKSDHSEYFKTMNLTVNLDLAYLKHLKKPNDKLDFYLGGGFNSSNNISLFDGTEAISFFNVHSVALMGRVNYAINKKHSIQSMLSIPVLGQLVRPPYTGWDKYISDNSDNPLPIFFKGNWTSLNDFQVLSWKTEYRYHRSDKRDLTVQYHFNYQHTNQLDKAIIAANQISLGLNFKK